MTGYYPHAAQDFHIAANTVLREIGRIITSFTLMTGADHVLILTTGRILMSRPHFIRSLGLSATELFVRPVIRFLTMASKK